MTIRAMTTNDLDAVVRVHQKAFAGFFLTRMGPAFLRTYYQTVLDHPGAIALVAQSAPLAPVNGFVVGFTNPSGFYALFSSRRRSMLPAVLWAVMRDPGLIAGLLRNNRRIGNAAPPAADTVELASIGVDGQGQGIGAALVEAFCAEAFAQGGARVALSTDADGNDTVRRFYERRGFVLQGYEDRGPRRLCHYVRSPG